MNAFAVGMMESNTIKPIILSCSKVGLGETSKDTVKTIKDIAWDVKENLEDFIKACELLRLDFQYDAPSLGSLAINNCSKADFATDTRNQYCKARILLTDEVTKEEGMFLLFKFISTNVALIDQHYQILSPDHFIQELDSDAPIYYTDNAVNEISEQDIRLKIDCHHNLRSVWLKALNKNSYRS